jgi:hypothetical protein
MAATKGLGTTGDGAGTVTPLDHKLAQAGLISKGGGGSNLIRPGLFYDGVSNIVVGRANMAYDVLPFTAVLTRGAAAGAVLLANDGVVTVATTAAPGSNSRIDVIYVWQREFSLDGVDSNPVIGVLQGTPAAVPVAPSLSSLPGAVELARATVSAGATATNGGGVVITQTAPFTSVHGGHLVRRTTAEMNAISTPYLGLLCEVLSNGITYRYSGSTWQPWSSPWIPYAPTLTNMVMSVANGGVNQGEYKFTDGDMRIRGRLLLGTTGASVGTNPCVGMPSGFALRAPLAPNEQLFGRATLFDTGVAVNVGYLRYNSTNTDRFEILQNAATAAGVAAITATSPWTWAADDRMEYDLIAKIA